MRLHARLPVLLVALSSAAFAAPLSEEFKIDFFRDVPSRNLHGLATRSDGRIVTGPILREMKGEPGAPLLWSIAAGPNGSWFAGTGPDGRIMQLSVDYAAGETAAAEWARVEGSHLYAMIRLSDGSLLAGSSPNGGLHLLKDGELVAHARLPADSIFDFLPEGDTHVLVGTGNPGRVYRLDLAKFAAGEIAAEPLRDDDSLAAHGIEVFGEVRDRNVRRLARGRDDTILAGSSPAGHLYSFPPEGGAPQILVSNTRAEITDLRVEPNGDVYALVVHAGGSAPARVARSAPPPASGDSAATTSGKSPRDGEPLPVEKFTGRSSLVWLPGGDGLPETVMSRSNIALYRMAAYGDLLIMAGGDAGEIVGYQPTDRRSLTFGGSTSAQLSDLVPLPGRRFLVLRNNPAGLALLQFSGVGPRWAETRTLDLRNPATLGALRVNRLREIAPEAVQVTLRANRAEDEIEGWSAWRSATRRDGGWHAPDLKGRYTQVRVELPADAAPDLEIDAASLFHLPQNRRPVLQSFHIITPNFGLIPRPEGRADPIATLGQLVSGEGPPTERRRALLGSPVVPQPGAQIVYWAIDDADGDELAATFSIRRDGSDEWIDLAVNRREPWVQFDRTHLPDGVYFTRLVVREQAPRAEPDRLEVTFATDDLVIDRTPPGIEEAAAERRDGRIVVTVAGRDSRSLLAGAEITLNNGHRITIEQPLDGILDGVAETFVVEFSDAEANGATAAEIVLYDAQANSAGKRIPLPGGVPSIK